MSAQKQCAAVAYTRAVFLSGKELPRVDARDVSLLIAYWFIAKNCFACDLNLPPDQHWGWRPLSESSDLQSMLQSTWLCTLQLAISVVIGTINTVTPQSYSSLADAQLHTDDWTLGSYSVLMWKTERVVAWGVVFSAFVLFSSYLWNVKCPHGNGGQLSPWLVFQILLPSYSPRACAIWLPGVMRCS